MASTTAIQSRVLKDDISLVLPAGQKLTGKLEHFPAAKSLVISDEAGFVPVLLTVPISEAPEAHDALLPGHVLLRNWTDRRGVGEALARHQLVELTGQEVKVGLFQLQALVARVL